VARHACTAISSRKNDKNKILPGSVRLSKRSTEIKPSIFSRMGRSYAAISRYSFLRSGFGQTSKMTAIMLSLP